MKRTPLKRTPFKRKKKKKVRKKTKRQRLTAELDRVFSLYIRERDSRETGGMCWFCRTNPIECCFHVIRRGKMSTRWDPRNCKGSCMLDNYKENYDNHPYIAKYIAAHGSEQYEDIVRKSRKRALFTLEELEEMVGEYKQKLDDFRNGPG